ncbi:MAG TPA: YgaP-like transmembrane domain [Gemmatimonadaceae bacterium]|nr:YgaP-like transmembrane domain [Gemmatimonadaceae bacterium]
MPTRHPNVNPVERVGSAVLGAALMSIGVRRRPTIGRLAAALAGTDLLYCGVTGHCHVYGALGVDTNGHHDQHPTTVRRTVSIGASADELERRWHAGNGAPGRIDGTVKFRPAPDGWGTEVALELQLHPAGGALATSPAMSSWAK